ncbi:MAG: PKD domain-containing protein [Planctomycetaceae bacterium]
MKHIIQALIPRSQFRRRCSGYPDSLSDVQILEVRQLLTEGAMVDIDTFDDLAGDPVWSLSTRTTGELLSREEDGLSGVIGESRKTTLIKEGGALTASLALFTLPDDDGNVIGRYSVSTGGAATDAIATLEYGGKDNELNLHLGDNDIFRFYVESNDLGANVSLELTDGTGEAETAEVVLGRAEEDVELAIPLSDFERVDLADIDEITVTFDLVPEADIVVTSLWFEVFPSANAGGPYAVDESSSVILDGSGSTGADIDSLTYQWDLDYDGETFEVDATGKTPDFTGADNGATTVALRVSEGTVTSEIVTTTVTVSNVAPTLNSVGTDAQTIATKSNDGVVTLNGFVTDASLVDTHEVIVDWGDGTEERIVAADELTLSPDFTGTQHTYAEGGVYTITVTATDDDGGTITAQTQAVVNQVPTVVAPIADLAVKEDDADEMIDLSDVFADIDDATLTYAAVSSDGSVVDARVEGDLLMLRFAADGNVTVTVTATDAAGESVTDEFTVTVNSVGTEPGVTVENGVLRITGTDGDDRVLVKKFWGKYYVFTNIEGFGFTKIRTSEVDEIMVDGGDGHDSIVMSLFVSVPTTLSGGSGNDYIVGGYGDDIVYAGSGNDRVWGGNGNDLLLGQTGNDRLDGGRGRDIIIAGKGADRLTGGKQDDVLITGDTNRDEDENALKALRSIWTGSGSARQRANAILETGLEVFHDEDVDQVWGGKGRDWILFDRDLDRR